MTQYDNEPSKGVIKIIKINYSELNNLAHENREIKDMYENNPEFKIVADYMLKGISETDLLVVLKDICKINDDLRKKMFNLTIKQI